MKRKLAVVMLSIMVFTMMFPAGVLADDGTSSGGQGNPSVSAGAGETEGSASAQGSTITTDESSTGTAGDDKTQNTVNSEAKTDATAETNDVDSSQWTAADFVYEDFSQTLYGCDYSREFTISGKVVAGFSDSGKEKVKTNKDLVIPKKDDQGNTIVGVGDSAFKNQGLTSVTFPEGMRVSYDDTVTNKITRRGNFVIGGSAFAGNKLTQVYLPDGVIAVLSNAFQNNKITTVTFPQSIWWIETQSFAGNQITKVNFPDTCDFQMEIHGTAFMNNQIKSVRLPDFTEVINKDTFAYNPGMEEVPADAPAAEAKKGGVVYMYTDNPDLQYKQRIHHIGRTTASQKSWHQKLVINSTPGENRDQETWGPADFTYDGTTVTGLSESGKEKRKTNKNLIIPNRNDKGELIQAIGSSTGDHGLFATETEQFDSVTLPYDLRKVGDKAFFSSGIKSVVFSPVLEEIGVASFSNNHLTSVDLPDTVTKLGGGAFSTNPDFQQITLSKKLTEIPAGAFGCSDGKNCMKNLTEIQIPEGVTSIGNNAFAGNNFHKIDIPSSVKSIGSYAFSTKNYLTDHCELTLPEGLETIGNRAFRNKQIASVVLPSTVKGLPAKTFEKEQSPGNQPETPLVTKVLVSQASQYNDSKNFPASDYHKLYLTDAGVWTADDFTYGAFTQDLYPASDKSDKLTINVWGVTGLSEIGQAKLVQNKNLVLPAKDPSGKTVNGVAASAFSKKGIQSVKFPENVKVPYSGNWNKNISERGNYVIGSSAFTGNDISALDLPEGVIYVGGNAFKDNGSLSNVKFPSTTMVIDNGAFAKCALETVAFPSETDFPLQIDSMSFAINKLKAVRIPDNTEKLTKLAFFQNTGKEPVSDSATANEKKGGVVHLYVSTEDELGSLIDTVNNGKSNVQKIIVGDMPNTDLPWNVTDFTYNTEGTAITGLSETGKEKIKNKPALVLPDKGPSGKLITEIGDGVNGTGLFGVKDRETLYEPESVELPSGLVTIGKFAFSGSKFKNISFPGTLTSIGISAFSNSALESVSLPDSVTTLGAGAFTNSANLKSVRISSGLKTIAASAFSMTAIEDLTVPEGVTTIDRMAFSGAHVKSVKLPSTLTTIGSFAFMNHQITSLTIPENATEIGSSAFTVTQDGLDHSLTSLTLNGKLESIGSSAFKNSSLESVEIPSTLKKLNIGAFADKNMAGQVKKVQLKTADKSMIENPPKTFAVKGYGHEVVYDKLAATGWDESDFTYDGAVITGFSESGAKKSETNKNLVLPDKAPDGTVITGIGAKAFNVPEDKVQQNKFDVDSPYGLSTVVLPEKLETIGDQAFEYNNFKALDLPDTLKTIGISAFHGNKLESLSLPDSVDSIGKGSFSMNSITSLKLPKNNANFTNIPQGAFSMNIRLAHIDLPDTVVTIDDMAFAGARLEELTIPASVKTIGWKAFHLHRIAELTIPGTVETIGESAFEGTYKGQTLKKLTIEEGVKHIGARAFKEGLLTEAALPKSVQDIGEYAFLNNTGAGADHTVTLHSTDPKQMAFNDTATSDYKVAYKGEALKVTDGIGTSFAKGEGDALKFTLNHPGSVVTDVSIDGNSLKKDADYSVSGDEKGRITLTRALLDTLKDGTHKITVKGTTGTDEGTFTVKKGENVMIEGMNGSWKKGGKGGLKFRSSANYDRAFTGRCYVTGVTDKGYSHELTEGKDMTTSSGSIRVELADSYLNTLEPGTYRMNIESSVGTATTEFTIGENGNKDPGTPGSDPGISGGSGSTKVVKTSVKTAVKTGAVRTGDDTSVILPAAALAAAVAVLVILLAWRTGQRNRKKTEK